MLITFYVTPVDTALSPGNSEAGEFDDVDVINFVFILEHCVVSFTPVGTALSPDFLRRNIPPSLLDRVVRHNLMMMLLMPTSWPPHRAGYCVLLMMLITFYATPVDTALSPGYSEAGGFDDVDVINFVFIFERCVVSFTPVGTALSPGYSEEKYTAFASRSCCSS
jgi:hypothetical protein